MKALLSKPVALIPAYKCEPVLPDLVRALLDSDVFQAIICVNDGSGPEYDEYFSELLAIGVVVINHVVNLGKGMALKTGMNHIACHYTDSVGIVTLDADGQHLSQDIITVGNALQEHPDALVMGCRQFDASVPFRSRFGNNTTKLVMKFLGGLTISDTQTGLRGINMAFVPHLLQLRTRGYDFELDMLLKTHDHNIPVIEVPIETVYIDGNDSSSFNPVLDSMRIYYVFLRFNLSSILSVIIDYTLFSLVLSFGLGVAWAIGIGRICAGSVNFIINRNLVFKSDNDYRTSLILYMVSLLMFGTLSYWIIHALGSLAEINLLLAKMIAEGLLYLFSFLVQRDVVFPKKVWK